LEIETSTFLRYFKQPCDYVGNILQNNKPSSVSFDPSQNQLFENSSCDPQFQKLN